MARVPSNSDMAGRVDRTLVVDTDVLDVFVSDMSLPTCEGIVGALVHSSDETEYDSRLNLLPSKLLFFSEKLCAVVVLGSWEGLAIPENNPFFG